MKKIVFIAIVASAFFACNSQPPKAEEKKEDVQVMSVDKFFADADGFVGKEIRIEGNVDHVCKHGGKRMFLAGSTPENRLKITTGDNIASFDVAYEGNIICVKGTVDMIKMDSAYLANWEKELLEGTHEKKGEGHGEGEGEEHDHEAENVENEAHDHTPHGEKADMGEHIPGIEKVRKYQQEIIDNGKGYIPMYTVVASEVNVKK